MLLKSLTRKIEKKYPLNLAEDWDNVGLIVGDFDMDVKKVLVSLEANEDVGNEMILFLKNGKWTPRKSRIARV